jgi:hypothetical protein
MSIGYRDQGEESGSAYEGPESGQVQPARIPLRNWVRDPLRRRDRSRSRVANGMAADALVYVGFECLNCRRLGSSRATHHFIVIDYSADL